MNKKPNAVEISFSTIQRLRPAVSPDHKEWSNFRDAWVIIYNSCEGKLRQLSSCRCGNRYDCVHQIDDLVAIAVLNFDKCCADGRLIKSPRAYLSKICLSVWLRAKDKIRRLEKLEVEYTEEPDYEAEVHQNWYEQIAKSIMANETKSLSWPEMRGMILKNLENKRLKISEVKVFLRHYRDGQKLKELAKF